VALLLSALPLSAGITGKIAGKVTEKESRQPLPGVEVAVVGTNLRALSDANGRYFILNVPPGAYELQVSSAGFGRGVVSGVRVFADWTTPVNFALSAQIPDTVELVAERPLLHKDLTALTRLFTDEQIQALPITTYHEAVTLTNGATSGGNNLRARRPGRGNRLFGGWLEY
jgi:hypothetical protein